MGQDIVVPPQKLAETSVLIELDPAVMKPGTTPLVGGCLFPGPPPGNAQNRVHRPAGRHLHSEHDMKTTRNLWPLGIIAAFVVFFAGTAGLIVMACAQKVDLVSADYYEQELRFQKRINGLDHAKELGERASVVYDGA